MHAFGRVIVISYNLYVECATHRDKIFFGIGPDDRFKIFDFHQFRDKLVQQELSYKHEACHYTYPGDENMCANAKKRKVNQKQVLNDDRLMLPE